VGDAHQAAHHDRPQEADSVEPQLGHEGLLRLLQRRAALRGMERGFCGWLCVWLVVMVVA
jgi:hypothetical protein